MKIQPSTDPVTNVIYQQIKPSIRLCVENEFLGAAIILIYSGIDTIASLSVPLGQDVQRSHFVRWADRYISLCREKRISGDEFYAARCAMLHTYATASEKTRSGRCRQIVYADHSVPPVRYDPSIAKDIVGVSVQSLAEAFCEGVDRFLVEVFSNPETAPLAEARLLQTCNYYSTEGSIIPGTQIKGVPEKDIGAGCQTAPKAKPITEGYQPKPRPVNQIIPPPPPKKPAK